MLSMGNRKLPKTTAIFNLPAIKTCPNSTPECRKYCYARKAERIYKQVLPFRERNLKATKKDSFIIDMKINIVLTKAQQVRIHESGDFYSKDYFDDWCDIADGFNETIFYAYTKNIKLDLSGKPNNMIILYSDDKNEYTDDDLKTMFFNGKTMVVDKNTKKVSGYFMCPGDCKACNYCYTKPEEFKKVAFKKH